MILPGLVAGLLAGLLLTAPLNRQASAPGSNAPASTPLNIARLSPAELETLAFDVLSTLRDKRGLAGDSASVAAQGSWNEPAYDPRQIHSGMRNVRRLLPLAKKLTLESLRASVKTAGLLREEQLIASVNRIVLDRRLGNAAEVWEENLSIIHIGQEYAASLASDDDCMLLLGHELTHVAARAGRLNQFIEDVTETARLHASIEPDDKQREELACDFIGAETLKRFITLHPNEEANAVRFARAIGYDSPAERLARAWQDFCTSYNGDPGDEEHLSQYQTIRVLVEFDPELKTLLPDEAISIRLCR